MCPIYLKETSDVEIFEQSGILKHIEPYDVILGDRGSPVPHLVNPLQAQINIPAFLKGRKLNTFFFSNMKKDIKKRKKIPDTGRESTERKN